MHREECALLSAPAGQGATSAVKYCRASSRDYADLSSEFLLVPEDKSYNRQFFLLYNARIAETRHALEVAVAKHFGPHAPIKNLSDLDSTEEADNKQVVIMGTLFKHQPLKPSILKELSQDQALPDSQSDSLGPGSYVGPSDEVILEDKLQRIRLVFGEEASSRGLSVSGLATGIVCAVLGFEIRSGKGRAGGKFHVIDMAFPESSRADASLPKQPTSHVDRYIVIASGLDLGDGSCDSLMTLELARSWLVGDAGAMCDQRFVAQIERLIIAGNCLSASTRDKMGLNRAKYLTKDENAASVEAVSLLDELLDSLCASIQVDLMPGENDPANQILPQQPLHSCLFPKASQWNSLRSVTNPYCFQVAGQLVVGTSGQNVTDLMRNTSLVQPLDALECLIKWGHLAPTCPDTLGCFPYHDRDPMVIKHTPDIFFAANQTEFGNRLIRHDDGRETLLVSVPKLSSCKQLCLVNVTRKECRCVRFDADEV